MSLRFPVGLLAGLLAIAPPSLDAQPARRIAPDSLHPYHPGVDVRSYGFRITLPDSGRTIRGAATLALRRDPGTDTLRVDLLAPMVVDRVTVHGETRAARRDSTRVHIPLRPSDGPIVRVDIRWHGIPGDGLIITEPVAGPENREWRAFGDNWPNRARHWLPTVDHPSDKATVQWTIEAPSGLDVVANGVRTRRVTDATRTTWHFAMRQPIPTYLMVLGAARMQETSLGRTACGHGLKRGCVPQSVWTFPEERDYAPGPFSEAGRIVSYFATTATGFPYARLAHLQSSTRFGGMENATAIFYSDKAFRSRDVGVRLIAHETAHQWFGNAISPRRWEDVWVSEGFATYWAALYIRHSRGDSAYHADLRRVRDAVLAAKEVKDRPIVDTVGAREPLTLLNRNSYEKAGFVLRMLHAELGDSVFFRGIRTYQQRYRHGTATTDAFRHVMEQAAGRSLAPFFTQWLHRPGTALLAVRWRQEAGAVVLTVRQETGVPYALPLDLVVTDRNGRSMRTAVRIGGQRVETVRVPIGAHGDVTAVAFDPEVRLLGTVTAEREPQ